MLEQYGSQIVVEWGLKKFKDKRVILKESKTIAIQTGMKEWNNIRSCYFTQVLVKFFEIFEQIDC